MSTFEEYLYLFLDNELDTEHEQKLFAELAYNTDLRASMKELLLVRSAVSTDVAVPPDSIKQSILLHASTSALSSSVNNGSRLAFISASSIVKHTVSASVGALVMWLLLTFPYSYTNNYQDTQAVSQANTQLNTTTTPLQQRNLQSVSTDDTPREFTYSTPVLQSQQYISTEKHTGVAQNPVVSTSAVDSASIQESNSHTTTYASPEVVGVVDSTLALALSHSTPRTIIEREQIPLVFESPLQVGLPNAEQEFLTIRIRGNNSQSITQSPLTPQANSLLDNVHIAALVKGSSKVSVGAEIGREAFVQNFDGVMDSRKWRISQYPYLWNAGIVLSYKLADLTESNNASLFGESTIGGVINGGPFARQTVGMRYSFNNSVSMVAGVQTSLMAFTFQDNWFTSSKFGLTYGVQYTLGR